MKKKLIIFSTLFLFAGQLKADEWDDIDDEFDNDPNASIIYETTHQTHYHGEVGGMFGLKGDFLPYFLTSMQHGMISPDGSQVYLRAGACHSITYGKFIAEGGVDLVGYAMTPGEYYKNNFHLHQLYLKGNYGKYSIEIGSREMNGEFVDPLLSSGNMVWSGNTRPEPGIRFGTDDFVSTVFSRGYLEMKANMIYGRLTDASYNARIYKQYKDNYLLPNPQGGLFYDGISDVRQHSLVEGSNFHRASIFLRTKSSLPVFFTLGAEHGVMFGGKIDSINCKEKNNWIKATFGGNGKGQNTFNHAMSYDLRMDARVGSINLAIYKQHYADDADGGLFSTGMDGLWGFEVTPKQLRWMRKVVAEYLQTTNQAGVVYANDVYKHMGDGKKYDTAGNSNIYHDQHMGAWAHYGMVLGNPMVASPIYNIDQYPDMASNMLRAYHLGVTGSITNACNYLIKLQHTDSWGTPFAPFGRVKSNTSAMLQLNVIINNMCNCSAVVAYDKGSLYGDNFGMGIKVSFSR